VADWVSWPFLLGGVIAADEMTIEHDE